MEQTKDYEFQHIRYQLRAEFKNNKFCGTVYRNNKQVLEELQITQVDSDDHKHHHGIGGFDLVFDVLEKAIRQGKIQRRFNLGSDFRPSSQEWYYLIVEPNGEWRVEMEKDWDNPNKEGYTMPISKEEIPKHSMDGVPLSEAIEKKLQELASPKE